MPAERIGFGEYELDCGELQLLRQGHRVRLERKPLELLILLAGRPGRLTRREEIIERIWGKDVHFDAENGVNNAIRKIRTALRDDPDNPRFVETAVGIGYRFIAPVHDLTPAPTVAASSAVASPPTADSTQTAAAANAAAKGPRYRRFARPAMLAVLLAGLVLAAWIAYHSFAHRHSPTPRIRALAVLPLNNLSGDPNEEYFADGMTDALITELAQIPDLKVISRTSAMQYKGTRQSLRQITQALDVDGVIEGSAVRSGDKVRITAQLIYAPADQHVWAENFEGSAKDVITLQDEVARAIAQRVRGRLGTSVPASPSPSHSVNSAAYEAYLRGRYFFDKRDEASATASVAYFRQAIALDPAFAPAYAGLAEALPAKSWFSHQPPVDVMQEAKAAATRALALDESSGEAHTALGSLLGLYDWDWAGAERELKRGLELSPSSSLAHERYAMWLQSMGRTSEAVEEARRAQTLDPLSFFMNRELGRSLYLARRYDEALHQLEKAAEMQPDSKTVWNFVALIYEQQGRRDDVVRLMRERRTETDLLPSQVSALQQAYARGGWQAYWGLWTRLHTSQPGLNREEVEMAQAAARLGHAAEAWGWMEQCADRRDVWATWIAVEPAFDSIRTDPRYERLLLRLHLVQPGR